MRLRSSTSGAGVGPVWWPRRLSPARVWVVNALCFVVPRANGWSTPYRKRRGGGGTLGIGGIVGSVPYRGGAVFDRKRLSSVAFLF